MKLSGGGFWMNNLKETCIFPHFYRIFVYICLFFSVYLLAFSWAFLDLSLGFYLIWNVAKLPTVKYFSFLYNISANASSSVYTSHPKEWDLILCLHWSWFWYKWTSFDISYLSYRQIDFSLHDLKCAMRDWYTHNFFLVKTYLSNILNTLAYLTFFERLK